MKGTFQQKPRGRVVDDMLHRRLKAASLYSQRCIMCKLGAIKIKNMFQPRIA